MIQTPIKFSKIQYWTGGVKNKELIELLQTLPPDADIIIEYCSARQLKYDATLNVIKIN